MNVFFVGLNMKAWQGKSKRMYDEEHHTWKWGLKENGLRAILYSIYVSSISQDIIPLLYIKHDLEDVRLTFESLVYTREKLKMKRIL